MGARRLCTAEVRVRFSCGPPIHDEHAESSTASLTRTIEGSWLLQGGSEAWNISFTVEILRSYLTGAGNAITVPVGKRVEGVSLDSKGSIHYNYRRGTQSILVIWRRRMRRGFISPRGWIVTNYHHQIFGPWWNEYHVELRTLSWEFDSLRTGQLNTLVAQRKSIVLIRRRSTFRNCPRVPISR